MVIAAERPFGVGQNFRDQPCGIHERPQAFKAVGLGGGASLGVALSGTLQAAAGVAKGAILAASFESLVSGKSFEDIFRRDFNLSFGFLGGGATVSTIFGAKVVAAGMWTYGGYYVTQGEVLGQEGGLTIGSATAFTDVSPGDKFDPTGLLGKTTEIYAQHEFGHTIQFFGLSAAMGRFVNPWAPYLFYGFGGILNPLGPWERLASFLGEQ